MFGKKNKKEENTEEDVFKIGGEEPTPEVIDEDIKDNESIVEEDLSKVEDINTEVLDDSSVLKEDTQVDNDDNNLDELLEEEAPKEKKQGFFSKLFSKKNKKEENTEEEIDNNVNIFDDFDMNTELGEEVNSIKKEINKDTYYYLLLITTYLKYFNLIIITIGIALFSYIYIQKDETLKDNSLLDPICNIILGDKIINPENQCSSLGYVKKVKNDELIKLKKSIFEESIIRLPNIYKIENFLNSKEIIFLLEKGESRLRPLEILSLFDDLKNKFEPILKSKISCSDFNIKDDFTLTASCYAYSTGWEGGGILGFNGDINSSKDVQGTSISLASSFLNFLEKQNSRLTLLEKQKVFSVETVSDPTSAYTKRTPFSIKMKYSTDGDLSL